ncbi:MAG: cell division protein FtsZ [Treponema sp.]|jgi:cell division protein FtsZ|nr:cell division protein FtsZ [Treponema sp.]
MNVLAVHEKAQVIQFRHLDNTEELTESKINSHNVILPAVIKVVSTGGGGANALNRIIESGLSGVEYISINTDIQDLNQKSKAPVKVQIGVKVTGGRGAGGKPEIGEKAALEDQDAIAAALSGADMVFLAAGMGGGTGTGSAHVIAKVAKSQGALTVAIVTTPFEYEGRYKKKLAQEGIAKLSNEVDSLIVIPNQHLFKIIDNNTSWNDAYVLADKVLCLGVQGIAELITQIGFQNVDFADVETIMRGKGQAILGIGFGKGENRAMEAVSNAVDNPLLEDTSIEGATGILVNIRASNDIKMVEINNILKDIKDKCDPDALIIHGLHIDPSLEDGIQITVIATGFDNARGNEAKPLAGKKSIDTELFDFTKYVQKHEQSKRKEYLPYLPAKDYHDDLDVPAVIRNHHYNTEEMLEMNKAQEG